MMLRQSLLSSYLAACLFLLSIIASSATASTTIDFSGFGSIVASKTTTKKNSNSSPNFGFMSTSANMRDLSLLGLRTTVSFDDKLAFTAQAVMNGRDDFKPTFDWAFVSYDFGQGWQLSVGRTRTPLFMYSSYQDVAYAYQWLAPPYSVYGLPQFKSVDGVKLRYFSMLGDWSSDLQVWGGTIEDEMQSNDLQGVLSVENNVGIAWDLERDWLRLHSVYMYGGKTNFDLTSHPSLADLLGGLQQLGQTQLVKALEWKDVRGHFAGLGVGMDFEQFFINAEGTLIYLDDNIATSKTMQSYYLMMGTRILPTWTLSLTLTHDRDKKHDDLIRQYVQADGQINFAPFGLPDAAGFEALVNALQEYTSKGFVLSARWDFHRSASAKAEYIAEERKYGGSGIRYRPQAIRIGVDFVF